MKSYTHCSKHILPLINHTKKITLLIIIYFFANNFGQASHKVDIIQQFYKENQQKIYWFSSPKSINKALEWLTLMETNNSSGMLLDKTHISKLRIALYGQIYLDSISKAQSDRLLTGMVLEYIKTYQQGNIHFLYDEVAKNRNAVYIKLLLESNNSKQTATQFIESIDCKDAEYKVLKKFLTDSITPADTLKYKTVLLAMNYRRYLSRQHKTEFVLINIPSAEMAYYKNDKLQFNMHVVVGKVSKPTPLLASYLTRVVAFPFWNTPRSIAVAELLPKVKKQVEYLEEHNFEIIDSTGNIVDSDDLNWEEYNKDNFPYRFRQTAGDGNALGLLKFVFKNPYSIYLHGTNWQGIFAKENRFKSHGCVRLEKPIRLANALLKRKIDLEEMKKQDENSQPMVLKLPHKVPVFITYNPLIIVKDKIVFLPDVYGRLK